MLLHVLDYDRGDTLTRISQLSTGLTITAPRGNPRVYDHEVLLMQADVLLIKLPCMLPVTLVLHANLEQHWPLLPKIFVIRIETTQLWLFPPQGVYTEHLLKNGLHLIEAVHDAIAYQNNY